MSVYIRYIVCDILGKIVLGMIRGFFLSQLKSWGINSVLKHCI